MMVIAVITLIFGICWGVNDDDFMHPVGVFLTHVSLLFMVIYWLFM